MFITKNMKDKKKSKPCLYFCTLIQHFPASVHLLLPSVHTAVPRWLYDTALCKVQGFTHQHKLHISRVQPQKRERIKSLLAIDKKFHRPAKIIFWIRENMPFLCPSVWRHTSCQAAAPRSPAAESMAKLGRHKCQMILKGVAQLLFKKNMRSLVFSCKQWENV